MPWKSVSIMSLRYEFVLLAQHERANIRELCRRFGISPKTAYKWLKRFKGGGKESLKDHSRRPHHSPLKTSKTMEKSALQIRDQHPAWGGRKIRARLLALGYQKAPSPSTLTALLHRTGRMDLDRPSSKPFQRFEYEAPNHLWQMDFKGDFPIGKERCHPLTLLDDHSRFNLCLKACTDQKTDTVQDNLTKVFRQYGLPDRMIMDNGPPWGYDGDHPYTTLTLWLIRLGIRVLHPRPYHPQTQGKEERFHRTLNAELLRYQNFRDLKDCQSHFDQWRNLYNLERPHQALEMKTPASRYCPSPRRFPEALPPIEYGPDDIIRKASKDKGVISFKGKRIKIGKAFRGHPLAIRPLNKDGVYDVYFYTQKITEINLTLT